MFEADEEESFARKTADNLWDRATEAKESGYYELADKLSSLAMEIHTFAREHARKRRMDTSKGT